MYFKQKYIIFSFFFIRKQLECDEWQILKNTFNFNWCKMTYFFQLFSISTFMNID